MSLKYGVSFGMDLGRFSPFLHHYQNKEAMTHPMIERFKAWEQYLETSHYKPGSMRGVYPLNILTPYHLKRPLKGDKTLEVWISDHNKERGTLIPLANDLILWKVPEDILEHINPSIETLLHNP